MTVPPYEIPPEDSNRIVAQLIPDTTGKTCTFETISDEKLYLPLVGWAVVIRVHPGETPEVFLEPVVDDDCMGPVPQGDLEEEVGGLKLVDVA